MAISLTCTCGAFLEIDDTFAGHMIQCPECGRSLQASPGEKVPLKTSGWAIASLLLSLVGAFTLVGTVLAVACGALGLRAIRKHPDRVAGKGYALAGIVLGFLFTSIGLLAFFTDFLYLDFLLRGPEWAGKLDFTGATKVIGQGFSLARPTSWGVYRSGAGSDSGPGQPVQHRDQVILVNVPSDAHAVGLVFREGLDAGPDTYRKTGLDNFARSELIRLLSRTRKTLDTAPVEVRSSKVFGDEGREVQELVVDVRPGKHQRSFLMRIIRGGDDIFVVAAGTRKSRFASLEKQLRSIVESFRIER